MWLKVRVLPLEPIEITNESGGFGSPNPSQEADRQGGGIPNRCLVFGSRLGSIRPCGAVTQAGTRYESIVLFECKDWKRPVSENEMMNLNGKVEVFGATRGVLVTPRISSGPLPHAQN